MRGLLLTPYFASGAALGTTKETSDRYRPLLRTHCEKFARGRYISADQRNTQELTGIRAEKPLRERGVIIWFAEAGRGLLDRIFQGNRPVTPKQLCTVQYPHQLGRNKPAPSSLLLSGTLNPSLASKIHI